MLISGQGFTSETVSSRTIEIYLIRHGETWNNVGIPERNLPPNAYIQGGNANLEDHKLCPSGRKQACDVGRFLKDKFPFLTRIYTGCLMRSVETAKLAAKEFGLLINSAGDSDEELAIEEECIIRKIDLDEIRHGQNDGKTTAKERNALYKAFFDGERANHPIEAADYDPYWKWRKVPSEHGAAGSFADAETSWHLLNRVIQTLIEIGDDHIKDEKLGNNAVAITSSAVILSLKTHAAWRDYIKKCAKEDIPVESKELPIFCEQSLAKNGGIYHFRYYPDAPDPLDKVEFVEEIQQQ